MPHHLDPGRPESGDALDLILDDHRRFEQLLRLLRDSREDRAAVRKVFADVHVAHGLAEEEIVYPVLRRRADDIGEHEVQHGHEEHAESNEALLRVLELADTDGDKFDDAVERLSNLVAHHVAEEELTIISPARQEVEESVRRDLGSRWAARRNELVDQGCGDVERVRELVREARQQGLVDDEPDEEE